MEIVVVGAALAGARAVDALREEGHDGPITLVGAEAHLPYERPPLSKGYLLGNDELESAFVTHGKLVKQAFLYANGKRTYPLAVLVPNLAEVRARHGLSSEPEPGLLRMTCCRVSRAT